MQIIDVHQDIALNAIYATGKDIAKKHTLHQGQNKAGLCVNNNVDLPRLKQGKVKFIFSTLFGLDKETVEDLANNPPANYNFAKLTKIKHGLPAVKEQLFFYKDVLTHLSSEIELVKTKSDYLRVKQNHKIGMILHSEGIDYFKSVADLDKFYDLGLRSLALTWRNKNLFASGNNAQGGLTDKGKKLLKKAQEKGVIIDLAHSNEQTFQESLQILKKPFMVSHTNCYGLCKNSRNITDEQIKLVAENQGVIGISAITEHIGGSIIQDYIRHISYIIDLAGPEYVCFGTDFDGMVDPEDEFMEGFEDVSKFPNMVRALKKAGLSQKEIEMVCYKNSERLILSNLQ